MNHMNILRELQDDGYYVSLTNRDKRIWTCEARFEMNGKDELICAVVDTNPESAIRKLYLKINPIKNFQRSKEPV